MLPGDMKNKAIGIKVFFCVVFLVVSYLIRQEFIARNIADGSFIVALSAIIFIWSVPVDKALFKYGIAFFSIAYICLYSIL